MAETYWPFEAGAGASVTELQWGRFYKRLIASGVFADDGNELEVAQRAAGANMSVDVATGSAMVEGHRYENDAVKNITIAANSSGSTRVDRIVLRLDRAANTITAEKVQGTPGAGAPALTQTTAGVYELPLAQVSVANGAASILDASITDQRLFSNHLRNNFADVATDAPADGEAYVYNASTGLFEPATVIKAGGVIGENLATLQTTTSDTFTDLATVGPDVAVTVGASGMLLLHFAASILNSDANGGGYVAPALSGANTLAASDANSIGSNDPVAQLYGRAVLLTGLAAGATTVTLKYRRTSTIGTASFSSRSLIAIPI